MAWTKQRYLTWLKNRGKVATWKRDDCRAADELIKRTTLDNFERYTRNFHEPIHGYLNMMARCYYGSAETDDMLTKLGMYPEWLEK